MRKTPSSFTGLFLIMLLLTGTIPTLTSLSLIDTEAFSDKKELDQHIEQNDYQKKYKQHDFEKYLSHQYAFYKEYTDYYDDLLNSVENSKKKPFTLSENTKRNFDEKKLDQSTTDNNNDKRKYVLEYDGKQSLASDDNKIYSSSDKSENKNYKDIKILECSNSNINAYEVEHASDVETILNKVIFSQNDDDDKQNDLQINNNNNNNEKEIQEYNIGKETKVIFICDNKNQKISPNTSLPDEDSNIKTSVPDEGILLS